MPNAPVSTITVHANPAGAALTVGGSSDLKGHLSVPASATYRVRGTHVLTLKVKDGSGWHRAAMAGTHLNRYQAVKITFDGGGVEWWRIESRTIDYAAGGMTVTCWPYWAMLDRRRLRVNRGTYVDYTLAMIDATPAEVLTEIFSHNAPPNFAAGTVHASLAAATVNLEINNLDHLSVLWALCDALAESNGGYPAEFEPRWVGSTCYIDIVPWVGASAAEVAAGYVAAPNTRTISGGTGGEGTLGNRLVNKQTDSGRDYFNRVIPVTTIDPETPVGIGRAEWSIVSAVYDGVGPDTTTITVTGSPLASPLEIGGYFGVEGGTFYTIASVTNANVFKVDGDASSLSGWGRFAENVSGRELVYLGNSEATGDDVNEQVVSFNIAPYRNLVEKAGSSADMSDGWGTLPTGASLIGTPTVTQYLASAYPEYVRSGTSGAHVSGNETEGIAIAVGSLEPTDEQKWHSVSVDLSVLSGRVRVVLVDSDGVAHPQGIEQAESTSKAIRSLQIGGVEAAAGTAYVKIIAQEDSTAFVVDAVAVTRSSSPYPYSGDMGPEALWRLALRYLREHGGSNEAYEVRGIDATWFDGAAADIEIGSYVRLQDGHDGSSYELDETGRVHELTLQYSTVAPVVKQMRVMNARPVLTSRLVGSPNSANVGAAPHVVNGKDYFESQFSALIQGEQIAKLLNDVPAGTYGTLTFHDVPVEIDSGTELQIRAVGKELVTFYTEATLPVTAAGAPGVTIAVSASGGSHVDITLNEDYDADDGVYIPTSVLNSLIYQNAADILLRVTRTTYNTQLGSDAFTKLSGAQSGVVVALTVDATPHRLDDGDKLLLYSDPSYVEITVDGDHAAGVTTVNVASVDIGSASDDDPVLYTGPNYIAEIKLNADEIVLRAKRTELIDDINTVLQTSLLIDPDKISISGLTTFAPGYNSVRSIDAAVAPVTRINGDALEDGDVWYDTSNGNMPYRWDGAAWVEAMTVIDGGTLSTRIIKSNNWAATAGSYFDLANGEFWLGGSSPTGDSLSFAGGTLTLKGDFLINADFWKQDESFQMGGTQGITYAGSGSINIGTDVVISGALSAATGTFAGLLTVSPGIRIGEDAYATDKHGVVLDYDQITPYNFWYRDEVAGNQWYFSLGNATQNLTFDTVSGQLQYNGEVYNSGGTIIIDPDSGGIIQNASLTNLTITGTLTIDGGSIVVGSSVTIDDNGIDLAGTVGGHPLYGGGSGDPNILTVGEAELYTETSLETAFVPVTRLVNNATGGSVEVIGAAYAKLESAANLYFKNSAGTFTWPTDTPAPGEVLTWQTGGALTWEAAPSGLDADTLDGLDSTQFLRSDEDDTFTGSNLYINPSSGDSRLYVRSQNGNAYLNLDSNRDGLGGENSGVYFRDNGSAVWLTYKNATDDWVVYDYANTTAAITIPDTSGEVAFSRGISAAGSSYIAPASGDARLYVQSQTGQASVWVDSNLDGLGTDTSAIYFADDGVAQWRIMKNASNAFVIYSDVDGETIFSSSASSTASWTYRDWYVYQTASNAALHVRSDTDNAYLYLSGGRDGLGNEVSGIIFQQGKTNNFGLWNNASEAFALYDYSDASAVFDIDLGGSEFTLYRDLVVTGDLAIGGESVTANQTLRVGYGSDGNLVLVNTDGTSSIHFTNTGGITPATAELTVGRNGASWLVATETALKPSGATYDLGASGDRWQAIYTTDLNVSGTISLGDEVLVSSGSAADPSFSFTVEPTTGLFLSSGSYLGFAVLGTEAMTLYDTALATGVPIDLGFVTTPGRWGSIYGAIGDFADATGPQLKLSYNYLTTYATFDVDSGGDLTILASGGNVALSGSVSTGALTATGLSLNSGGASTLVTVTQDNPQSWVFGVNSGENYVIRDNTGGDNDVLTLEAGAPDNALYVTSSGALVFGTTATALDARLYIAKTYSGVSGSDVGAYFNFTQDTASTGGLRSLQSLAYSTHTTGTVASLRGGTFGALANGVLGTTTELVSVYGSLTIGAGAIATDPAVFYGTATITGTATNGPWMFYGATAIPSYFAGAIRVGSTSPTSHGNEILRVSAAGSVNPLVNVHGTDSAAVWMHFTNSATGTTGGDGFWVGIDSDENGAIWQRDGNAIRFLTASTERLRISGSGPHIAVGHSDLEAWSANYAAFEFYGASIFAHTSTRLIGMGSNLYYDGLWRYKTANVASRFDVDQDGNFEFRTASSGLADAEITWTQRFSIDNDGSMTFSGGGLFKIANAAANTDIRLSNTGATGVATLVLGSNAADFVTLDTTTPYWGPVTAQHELVDSGNSSARWRAIYTKDLNVSGSITLGDEVLVASGSAADPSFSFTVEPTTGLFLSSGSYLGITVLGTEVVTVLSDALSAPTGIDLGYVTTPGRWGTLYGEAANLATTSGPQLRLAYNYLSAYTDFTTDTSGNLTIAPTGGNVGITTRLDLSGNLLFGSATDPGISTTYRAVVWTKSNVMGSNTSGNGLWASSNAYFNGTNWIFIDSDDAMQLHVDASYIRIRGDAGGTGGATTTLPDLLRVTVAGVVEFGSTADTNLYRSAANTLKTDDSFTVGGTLVVTGYTELGLSGGYISKAWGFALRRSGVAWVTPDLYGDAGYEGLVLGYDLNGSELQIKSGAVVVSGTMTTTGVSGLGGEAATANQTLRVAYGSTASVAFINAVGDTGVYLTNTGATLENVLTISSGGASLVYDGDNARFYAPGTDGTFDLGRADKRWQAVYAVDVNLTGALTLGNSLTIGPGGVGTDDATITINAGSGVGGTSLLEFELNSVVGASMYYTSGSGFRLRLYDENYRITDSADTPILTITESTAAAVFAGAVTASSFSGSGASLTALNATNLSSGTVASARLSGAYTGVTGLGTLTSLTVSGVSTFSDGLETAPGITFASAVSADMGFWAVSATKLAFVSEGVEIFRFTKTALQPKGATIILGGEANPWAEVWSAMMSTAEMRVDALGKLYLDGGGGSGDTYFHESSANTVQLYTGGYLAINSTASVSAATTTFGGGAATSSLIVDTNGNSWITLSITDGGVGGSSDAVMTVFDSGTDSTTLTFKTANAGTEATGLYIDSAQKLWIGSTADTNLYRLSANVLMTDDAFVATGSITGASFSGASAGITNAVTAGQFILGTNTATGPGYIYKQAAAGTVIYSAAGSTYDFTLVNSAGTTVAYVPTGTTDYYTANVYAYGVIPRTSSTYDLGSTTKYWDALWVNDIMVTGDAVAVAQFAPGAQGTGGTLNWNDSTNARPGSGYSLLLGNATTGPGVAGQHTEVASYYFHTWTFEYAGKDATGNRTQFAVPYGNVSSQVNAGLFVRTYYGTTWGNWYGLTQLAPDGDNSTPGMAFAEDPDTGFYRSTGNAIDVSVGGTGAYRFNSNAFFPTAANTYDLGLSGYEFDNVYARYVRGDFIYADGTDKSIFNVTAGGVASIMEWQASGTEKGHITNAGNLYIDALIYQNQSDARAKDDVLPLSKALHVLSLLNPVTYTWNALNPAFSGQRDVGLIAQEVAKVWAFPVWYREDKDRWGLIYEKFVPLLISGVNEVKSEVDRLRDEIATLKERIAALESA